MDLRKKKQRLFPYTALTGWFYNRDLTICSSVFTTCTNRFNIHLLYVLTTQYIYVFCVGLRTNSDYFPIRTTLTDCFYNWDLRYIKTLQFCTWICSGVNLITQTVWRHFRERGGSVGSGTAPQTKTTRVRFPMVSLEIFIDIILPAALWPWGRLSL
jgi:hypothetical protein